MPDNFHIVPVILSGGNGTRLWPLSRASCPKQFLALSDSDSLLKNTLDRLPQLGIEQQPIIVCNEQHQFMILEQLQKAKRYDAELILEPGARNTAPAVAGAY